MLPIQRHRRPASKERSGEPIPADVCRIGFVSTTGRTHHRVIVTPLKDHTEEEQNKESETSDDRLP